MACKKIILTLIVLPFISCTHSGITRQEFVLGTISSVTFFEQGRNRVFRDVFARLREIDNLMSVNIPSSDISRINAAAGIERVRVHEDTFKVIKRALFFASLSGGDFDPTIRPIVSLWDIGGSGQRIPSQEEITATLPLINWRNVEINKEDRSVFLTQKGMALDLGGIAKGFAADEAAKIIRGARIRRAIVDLGGNIIVIGTRRDGAPWRVGIQNPLERRGLFLGVLQTGEKTIVTSSISERYFKEDGVRYHHIFSVTDGFPVKNNLLSITVISENSMDADALSTAVFSMGYERGIDLINSLPNTEAVFIFYDYSIRTTPGVNFTITDSEFYLK